MNREQQNPGNPNQADDENNMPPIKAGSPKMGNEPGSGPRQPGQKDDKSQSNRPNQQAWGNDAENEKNAGGSQPNNR